MTPDNSLSFCVSCNKVVVNCNHMIAKALTDKLRKDYDNAYAKLMKVANDPLTKDHFYKMLYHHFTTHSNTKEMANKGFGACVTCDIYLNW